MSLAKRFLRLNFVIAVWLGIILGAVSFAGYVFGWRSVLQQYGPFAGKVALAPLGLAFAQLVLWFRLYRFSGPLARIGAGIFGMLLALVVLVQLLRNSVGGKLDLATTLLFSYFAAAHLLYALLDRRLGENNA